jgi:hypothetical protein
VLAAGECTNAAGKRLIFQLLLTLTEQVLAARAPTGKTVLVTGGTGGNGGRYRPRVDGRTGGHHRPRRGPNDRAAAEIADESGSTDVDVFVADMSSQAEVRRLAGEVTLMGQRCW